MIVAGENITLPAEDPLAYQVDWRHRVATAVCREAGHRLPRSLPKDKHLLEYTSFTRQEESKRDPSSVYSQAVSWHANEVHHAVESLLITAGSYAEIAQVLNVSGDALLAYSKVFFDVRNNDGVVLPNAVLNVRFNLAVPANTNSLILRNAALTGGYALVKSMVAVNNAAPVDLSDSQALRMLVNDEFSRRLLSGHTSPADLSRIITAQAALEKVKLESGEGNNKLKEVYKCLHDVLALTAPTLLKSGTATAMEDAKQYHDRVAAFQAVNKTAVADSGTEAAVKKWNELATANMQGTPG